MTHRAEPYTLHPHPLLQVLQPPGVDLQRHVVAGLAAGAARGAGAPPGAMGPLRCCRQRALQRWAIHVAGELEQAEAADALVLGAVALLWKES